MLLGSVLWPTGRVLWVLSVGVVTVIAVVMLVFFRSFRRWQQPPPGQKSEAARAESFLSWMTRTRGDRG
jgi:membrane protein required for beta-lactamase induction